MYIIYFFSLLISFSISGAITFSFQKQKDPASLETAAKEMAQILSKDLNEEVKIFIPTSYGASVQAMIAKKIDVAYMDSLPFVLANRESKVEIIAVEERNNKNYYSSIIAVRKDSSLQKLSELQGKHMAFTSPTSTSGYLFPYSTLVKNKILKPGKLEDFFSKITFAGGYDKAVQALVNGQADVAAFSDYVIEGPRADLYTTQEQRNKIRILQRIEGVPTHLIAIRSDLPNDIKLKIKSSLLKLHEKNPHLLSSVYGAAKLIEPGKVSHVQKTLDALESTNLNATEFVR